MDQEVQIHQRLTRELRPLFEMLMHKLDGMVNEQWLELVQKTKKGVLTRPDQYISDQAAISPLELSVIEDIFKEFVDRMGRSRPRD